MDESQHEADLQRYLQSGRDALLGKLEGVSEYDVRRPLVPTGTNLLGLVKHMAGVEAGYFGAVFARPFPEPLLWMQEDAEDNADMWATAHESREVVALYRRVWAHADATIAQLDLDASGRVPWWGSRDDVTLQRVPVHVIAELHCHAGHADVARELIDGAAGVREGGSNLPGGDTVWWAAYRDRLEQVARQVGDATVG